MREIWFRAWDKSKFKMIYFSFSDISSKDVCQGMSEIMIKDLCYEHPAYGINPDIEIMEFTGLHDKTGKPIYSGDLLVWNDDKQAMYEVFYNDDEAKYDCCRVHYIGNRCGGSIPYITSKLLEVFGNIHENPELLKES